jgi:TatD DNase family protein
MHLIDTHAHLDDDRFEPDLATVLDRAKLAGVLTQICIATTLPSSRRCLQLAAEHDSLYASVGIHPNNAAQTKPADWDDIRSLIHAEKVVALGETGLDHHWDFTPFPVQQDYFARHLALSRETGLPVVIHCREAENDMLTMLRSDFLSHGPLRGVMHSFTGNQTFAEACLEMGLHLSFAGMLTYKNAAELRSVAARVPSDRILVETDSPYLTPEPLRGKVKRNEPANVVHTATTLAQVRGQSLDQLADHTTANARELFKI